MKGGRGQSLIRLTVVVLLLNVSIHCLGCTGNGGVREILQIARLQEDDNGDRQQVAERQGTGKRLHSLSRLR